MSDTYWRDQAVCRDEDPELFFPEGFKSPQNLLQAEDARVVCRRCPVRAACLADAMRREGAQGAGYRNGVVGGLLPSERHKLYRKSVAPHENAQIEKAARETARRYGGRVVQYADRGLTYGKIATRLRQPTEVVRRAHALILSGQVTPTPERDDRPVLAA